MGAFRKFVFGFALLISLLVAPPVFDRYFVMVHLFDGEKFGLWVLSAFLILLGAYGLLGRRYAKEVAFFLFNVLLLISLECSARAGVKLIFPDKETRLGRMGNLSYDDLRVYHSHPFLQFTGIPSRSLIGNQTLGSLAEFNNFGFVGQDFVYKKPEGVIRLAALGGSTTARGYPALLDAYLNAGDTAPAKSFEVMNFGLGFYTSAHTLVNFVLNVVDFEPDYVIIHHGWNDIHVRASEKDFRGDYSHHLKAFEPPKFVIDRYLLRTSVIYRTIKFFFGPPDWVFIESASQITRITPQRPLKVHELDTFQRNLETIIEIARTRNIRVILTTMPHTTDREKRQFEDYSYIDQFNDVTRSIVQKYEDVILVDLDNLMTGSSNHLFIDLAHLNNTGMQKKAQYIGEAILKEVGGVGMAKSLPQHFTADRFLKDSVKF